MIYIHNLFLFDVAYQKHDQNYVVPVLVLPDSCLTIRYYMVLAG